MNRMQANTHHTQTPHTHAPTKPQRDKWAFYWIAPCRCQWSTLVKMSGTKSQHGGHDTDKDSDYVDGISTNNPGITSSGDSIYDFPFQKSYKHNPYEGSSLTEPDSEKELYMDAISAGDRFLEFG